MSHIVDIPLIVPALPASWTPPSTSTARLPSKQVLSCSERLPSYSAGIALQPRRLLPSGPAYLAHVKRTIYGLSFEDEDRLREEEERSKKQAGSGNTEEEDDLGVGDEEETEELLALDPKEWKVSELIFCCFLP